jgi:DNA mismatch repair protein MutS
LLILDEVGRGTSTFDGVSLAWAIVEVLAGQLGARSLFATHYHELTALAESFPKVRNYNFAVKEWNDEIIFLRKVIEGASDKSYGIHVARLAGIPPQVLERAREILANLESQNLALLEPAGRPQVTHANDEGQTVKQLDLFQDRSEAILRELRRLDVDQMTPVQALQYLAELQKRIV